MTTYNTPQSPPTSGQVQRYVARRYGQSQGASDVSEALELINRSTEPFKTTSPTGRILNKKMAVGTVQRQGEAPPGCAVTFLNSRCGKAGKLVVWGCLHEHGQFQPVEICEGHQDEIKKAACNTCWTLDEDAHECKVLVWVAQ